MKDIINKIVEIIFPMITCRVKSKKVENKDPDTSVNECGEINLCDVKEKYLETFKIKNNFEEKAKTTSISITIVITLIINIVGTLTFVEEKYNSIVIKWLCFSVVVLSILYFFFSGYLAMKVLFDKNVMKFVDIDKINDKSEYLDNMKFNINSNIIRNNYLSASFACIRNGLICIIVFFIFAILPNL